MATLFMSFIRSLTRTLTLLCSALLVCSGAAQAYGLSATPQAFILKYHNAADLDRLIANQSDPASPLYGKYLTADEFRRYYAPTLQEYAQTIAQLQRAGYTVTRTYPNRTMIDAIGPTIASRSALALPQRDVVPAFLPFVDSVVAAGSRVQAFPRFTARSATPMSQLRHRHRDPEDGGFLVGPDGGFGPAALTKAVNFPTYHGFDGRGVKVADVIDGAPVDADIQTFLQAFGIRRTGPATTVVPVDGGNGPDADLALIDAEWIVAAAPGVSLYAYNMSAFSDLGLVDAYNQVVSDNIVDVVNTSLSRCESDTVNLALAVQPIIKQGAAQGIAFESVAFGGVNVCGIPDFLFSLIPADSADSLAVGGSNVIENADGEIIAQTGMPKSGGAISAIVPVFPEQQRIHGVDPSGRNVPDLIIPSEVNGGGSSLYFAGGWNNAFVGVFANNAPMAGLLAEYQQMAHHRLGAVNRTLYNVFARRGYSIGIVDIRSGCNGMYLNAPVCAKRGYDLTSGIGAISDAYRLGRSLIP
jgi:subtilase family serine protease